MEEVGRRKKKGIAPRPTELSSGEVEELTIKLFKGGNPPSKIGLILRDQYGVPSVKQMVGKSITQILEEHGLKQELPEDLTNLLRKAVFLRRHLEKNRKDIASRRALELLEGKIQKLVKYYVRTGALPEGWRYEPEKAALLVR
jgi:small subunit ribosomal protein S15